MIYQYSVLWNLDDSRFVLYDYSGGRELIPIRERGSHRARLTHFQSGANI